MTHEFRHPKHYKDLKIEEQKKQTRIGNHFKREWGISDKPKPKDEKLFENLPILNQGVNKPKNNPYPEEASPQQVADLSFRLEKSRQMSGAEPTKLKDLEDRYKKPTTLIKKSKPKPYKVEPVKIDTTPFQPLQPIKKDPIYLEQERNFIQLHNQMIQEKMERKTKGLAWLIGGTKYDF
jgi:hypothetical protein